MAHTYDYLGALFSVSIQLQGKDYTNSYKSIQFILKLPLKANKLTALVNMKN